MNYRVYKTSDATIELEIQDKDEGEICVSLFLSDEEASSLAQEILNQVRREKIER